MQAVSEEESAREEKSAQRRQRIAAIAQGQGLLLMLVLIVIYFASASPYFFTLSNALVIGASAAALGVMAVTQTFLIISGGIDVSVGSVVAISGVVMGILITDGWSFWIAAVAAVLTGALVGVVNAILVVGLKINPFIATLGTMSLFSGLAFTLTSGETRVIDNSSTYGGVPRRVPHRPDRRALYVLGKDNLCNRRECRGSSSLGSQGALNADVSLHPLECVGWSGRHPHHRSARFSVTAGRSDVSLVRHHGGDPRWCLTQWWTRNADRNFGRRGYPRRPGKRLRASGLEHQRSDDGAWPCPDLRGSS